MIATIKTFQYKFGLWIKNSVNNIFRFLSCNLNRLFVRVATGTISELVDNIYMFPYQLLNSNIIGKSERKILDQSASFRHFDLIL